MPSQTKRTNPAFYALVTALILMAVGPIVLMLLISLRMNFDIMSDDASLIFMPKMRNYEAVLCDVLWYKPEDIGRCDPTFARSFGNSLTEYDIDWGVIMATGMLLAIPPILFTFIASRQIITGMTAGTVKG